MTNPSKIRKTSSEKLIAKDVNGIAAMMGFFAAMAACFTSVQIIPGVI